MNEEKKDFEAAEILKYSRQHPDMAYKELGEHFKMSASTIGRRIKRGKRLEKDYLNGLDEGEEEDEEESTELAEKHPEGGQLAIENVAKAMVGIQEDERVAEGAGTITGINAESLVNTANKIYDGDADKQEIFAFGRNVSGILFGAMESLNKREELNQKIKEAKEKQEEGEVPVQELKEIFSELSDEEKRELLKEGR